MEILAAKKQPTKTTIATTTSLHKKADRISIRINAMLYNTMQNYLSSMQSVGDYSYSSISDILRKVLLQMEQKQLPPDVSNLQESNAQYIEIVLRVTSQQKQFWQSLPNRSRRKILEKAVTVFIDQINKCS